MSAKPIFLAVSSLVALALAAGAQAASFQDESSYPYSGPISVSLAGLDLNGTAGAQIALRRIQRAAGQLCGGAPSIADLERTRIYGACVKDAVDHTVAALGNPVVAALNAGTPAPRLTASR